MVTQESALANAFLAVMRGWLAPSELAEIDRLNAAEQSLGICHSHDFCDANMAMHEAFVELVGREPDVACDRDAGLWSEAWRLAAEQGFAPKKKGKVTA